MLMYNRGMTLPPCFALTLLLTLCSTSYAWQVDVVAPPAPGVSSMRVTRVLAPLKELGAIRAVRFVMDIPFTEYPAALSAKQLDKVGCHYATDDPRSVEVVAMALRNADVAAAPVGHATREPRQLLDIEFVDGTTLAFQFGEVFPVDDVMHGSVDGLPVTARKALQGDLFRWAKSMADQPEKCRAVVDRVR
jgi:hypothetical protein